eukprot:GDKJ01018843.1.p1 GENE.GDKJ01018843.1~~GDKJ01018843.1.p1  ORF type:complete len:222 (+),score=13.27 GDKJ01018843.1:782-1447(+)
MSFIDIHTHRIYKKEGVEAVYSVDLASNANLMSKADAYYSVGLHPWYATLAQLPKQLVQLKELAKQPNVIAIGECGLDKLKGEPLHNQLLILTEQINLAQELSKPLIIHCVKAFDELIFLKKALNVKVPMVIHGFNKNEALGKQLLLQGFTLSFGKSILNTNSGAAKLIQVIDQFYLETDDDNSTIETIYAAAAKLKNCSVDELKARIFANWKKLTKINNG